MQFAAEAAAAATVLETPSTPFFRQRGHLGYRQWLDQTLGFARCALTARVSFFVQAFKSFT